MNFIKKALFPLLTVCMAAVIILALSACGDETCTHSFGSWKVEVSATCDSEGVEARVCSLCGERETSSIKAVGHSFTKYIPDDNDSCVSMGTETAVCDRSDCNKTDTKAIPGIPVGHTYKNGVCTACNDAMTLLKSYDASAAGDGSVTVKVYESKEGHLELDIVGSGAMADYSPDKKPEWNGHKDTVTAIHVSEGVTTIGDYAFYDFDELGNVFIEKGLKSVGTHAFSDGFAPYRAFVYDIPTWVSIEFEDEGIPSLYQSTFIYFNNAPLRSLVIDEGVTKINPYAFYGSSTILSVIIPESLKEIGKYAFFGCTALEEFHIKSLESWFDVKIDPDYANPMIYADDLFINDVYIAALEIPATITTIPNNAFEGCDSIKSVEFLGDNVVIGDFAFYECKNISEIDLSGVSSIGKWAFLGCKSLQRLDLGATVSEIGSDAFRDCSAIEAITAPTGSALSAIGSNAFDGCTSLLTFAYRGTETDFSAIAISADALPEDVEIVTEYFEVTFVFDEESSSTAFVSNGGRITAPVAPENEGYILSSWMLGDTEWSFDNDTVTADITLTAVWTETEAE